MGSTERFLVSPRAGRGRVVHRGRRETRRQRVEHPDDHRRPGAQRPCANSRYGGQQRPKRRCLRRRGRKRLRRPLRYGRRNHHAQGRHGPPAPGQPERRGRKNSLLSPFPAKKGPGCHLSVLPASPAAPQKTGKRASAGRPSSMMRSSSQSTGLAGSTRLLPRRDERAHPTAP